jgi:hypothetical protein
MRTREVDDIVGTVAESARCERHETAVSWWERFKRAGVTCRGDAVVSVRCATPTGEDA